MFPKDVIRGVPASNSSTRVSSGTQLKEDASDDRDDDMESN